MKELRGGTFRVEPQIVPADSEAVVVYGRVTAQRERKTLDIDQVNLYRFNEEGRVIE